MLSRKFKDTLKIDILKIRKRAFINANLQLIEDALVKSKIRLAANISRLRIGGLALTLDKLLPIHLRNTNDELLAFGWVNTIKIPTKLDFINEMKKLGFILSKKINNLYKNEFNFDTICPKVIILNDSSREILAQSNLVKNNCFIFLDKTLCLGAAALVRIIKLKKLCGPVILTHTIAPRHTAYLISILADIENTERLLVFDAGEKREEYDNYLKKLGFKINEYKIFTEKYNEAPGFSEMERATVVLAAPNCSYTGLKDIVDLVIARGGDMELLEKLTNINDELQMERPRQLLAEQLSILKYALTKPNVQLLVYQTHSILPSETTEMVEQVVQYANKMARDKYTKDHPRRKSPKETSPKNCGRSSRSSKRSTIHQDSRCKSSTEDYDYNDDDNYTTIIESQIPDSDLFEICQMSDLRIDNSSRPVTPFPDNENGCYICIIRRREMMQFNSLFMIKVAETKGLFGDPNVKNKDEEKEEIKEDKKLPIIEKKIKYRKKKKIIKLDSIAAPTHSSIIKSGSHIISKKIIDNDNTNLDTYLTYSKFYCQKYKQRIARNECELMTQIQETRRQDARRWWEQSAIFLTHAAKCESCKFRIFHTDPWTQRVLYAPKIHDITFDHHLIQCKKKKKLFSTKTINKS